jgi:thioredoxin-related protein
VAALLVALGVLASPAAQAAALQRIDGVRGAIELPTQDRTSLVVVYEDQCGYCLRMLATVAEAGGLRGIDVVAVGVGANRAALRRWGERAGTAVPLVLASTRFIASIAGVEATPITLLFDAGGSIQLRLRGAHDAATFATLLDAVLRHPER